MAERRGNCWSTAGQRHVLFKDDLEELLGRSGGGGALLSFLHPKLTLMMSSL